MHKKLIALILSSVTIFKPAHSEAKVLYYGSDTEVIPLVYGGPTIFRFDQEVQTISEAQRFQIEPADPSNPNYTMLSVTPRFSSGKNKVSFILSNGAILQTELLTLAKASPEKTDSLYDFKSKESLLQNLSSTSGGDVTDLELMKAMIRLQDVVGYTTKALSERLESPQRNVSIRLMRLYSGPKYNGYVYKVVNSSSKNSFHIDLQNLSLGRPNMALLSQVDRADLKPESSKENETYLRVVSKPTSLFYNIHLPIGPITEK